MRPERPSRPAAWLATVLAALCLGAGGPEVVRVRIPAGQVSAVFPAGTELKGMSAAEFEALARAARAAPEAAPEGPPRVLRARHSARWEDGLLVGRSELVVGPARCLPGVLALDPWTPAVDPAAEGGSAVGSLDTGGAVVRVGPPGEGGGPAKVVVGWQLRARPGSRGRTFALGLPGAGVCELVLDLPEGSEPVGPPGLRTGPTRVDGRDRWVFLGPTGACDLAVTGHEGRDDAPDAARLWVEGPTRADVGESAATWSLDWSVSGGPRSPRHLVAALDPGLDVLSVSGPEVEDYRAEPAAGGATVVTVRLRGAGKAPARVSVRALARVPSEGAWAVPSARPVGAVWTGGTTTVHLDPSRVVESVRPLAGRRTAAPAGEAAEERRLDFEAARPGPVAELVFRKPRADVSAEVRGQLLVGSTSPRLTCRVAWAVHRGRPQSLEVDLPRSWVADRVEMEGVDEPVSWHPEDLPGRGVRVHVAAPSGDRAGLPMVLNLSATSSVAGGRGPLALPRVVPVGVRVADEVWVARVESGLRLRPTLARGLAWIDPAAPEATSRTPAPAPGSEGALPAIGWRWTADDAEARVERERSELTRRATVEVVATVAPDRLGVEARVSVVSHDDPVRSLTLGLSEPDDGPGGWRFFEESTGGELPGRAVTGKARAAAVGLGRGPAWRVDLPHPRRGRVVVVARHAGRWDGHGRIPLVVVPGHHLASGTVLILAGRDVRTSATAEGARVLDPEMTAELPPAAAPPTTNGPPPQTSLRHAHAFAYDSPSARVDVRATALGPAEPGGVIREAVLTTLVNPRGGPGRRHLSLHVAPDGAPSVEVTLPPGSVAERVLRDGRPVATSRAGRALSVPLGVGDATRPLVVVSLDYRVEAGDPSGPSVVRAERPGFSFPCLSLSWEVVVPGRWAVADWGPALTPDDPAATGRARGARDWLGRWRWGRAARRDAGGDEVAREFEGRLAADRPEETTLGDWLTRLDGGRFPVVVDRVGVAGAGLGPHSPVVPPRAVAGRPATAAKAFGPLGLAVAVVGRSVVVTTPDEAAAAVGPRRGAWEAAAVEAVAWGSEPSDRFQSVPRWRAEAMPRASAVEPPAAAAATVEGRVVSRFVAPGWPAAGAEVRLVDRRQQAAAAWGLALALWTAGALLRGLPRAARASGAAALLGLGAVATAVAPPGFTGAADGLFGGAVGLAFFWLGESLPGLRRFWPRGGRSTPSTRRGGLSAVRATPALVVLGLACPWALAQTRPAPEPGPRIPVLFPFEGLPDLSRAPDRAVLRLADYERLRGLADAGRAGPPASLEATAARHRVAFQAGRRDEVVVETGLTLSAAGRGPAHWSFPVEDAREITATLDGDDVPVRVEPGGRSATVRVDVAGEGERSRRERPYALVLRRVVTPRRRERGESVRLAVNPVAAARVEVDGHPDGLRGEVPCARGRLADRGDGLGPAGLIGPVDLLDVRWSAPGGPAPPADAAEVSGLYLWDATPAGDRVRARLTYRNPGGTEVVRLALGAGVLVRDVTVPGAADVSLEGSPERPEWVARIAPLPDGETIAVDVYRPRGDEPAGESTRAAPRVEPMGAARVSGLLAFRRPADYDGRVAAAAGTEPAGDEAFVRAWGPTFPNDPLTLSGTVRLLAPTGRTAWPEVSTGPRRSQFRVQPSVQLAVASGRVDAAVTAELTETAGPVDEVEVAFPEGFRVVRVSADGLAVWTRAASSSVRLRFEGPPLRQRRVRIEGWAAVPSDPLAAGVSATSREADVPWPRWVDQDEQPGALSVSAPSRFQLVGPSGAVAASSESGPPHRLSYRVTRTDAPGRLRWDAEPPRVKVSVQSQVAINPDEADWVAVLLYDVSGGPLDAINLKLPTAWASSATVWLDGVTHKVEKETRPDPETRRPVSFWTVRPGRPIWGSQKLVLRSSVPFGPGEVRSFPDLSPLGNGKVDTSLRIVNATRRPISIEGSRGIQPVSPQSFAADEELSASVPRAGVTSSYHVVRSGWSLGIQKSGGPPAAGSEPGAPRVEHAEVACTLAEDGSVLGAGFYEVGPRSGPFLGVELPDGSRPVWASVNGTPARPLVGGHGHWQVPLAGESASRLVLVWQSDPPSPATARATRAHPVPLPVVGRGRVPAVVTVRAPGGVVVRGRPGRLAASTRARVELEKAEWLGRETAGSLARLDRSSPRDGEDLVAALARFEVLTRDAGRAADWEPARRDGLTSQARQAADRLRNRLAVAVHAEALDEFLAAARGHLGFEPEPVGDVAATPPTPEPVPPVQVRPLGTPHEFVGELTGAGGVGTPSLEWSARPATPASPSGRPWPVETAAATALAPLLAWWAARRTARPRALGSATLAAGLAVTAGWGGPAWLAAVTGFAALGWFTRPRLEGLRTP